MDDTTQSILVKLTDAKKRGLTFYQATQQLQQDGFTQAQIAEAADQFNYSSAPGSNSSNDEPTEQATPTIQTPVSPPFGSELDMDYQKLGNAVLADKERSARPYAYVALVIPAAGFAMQAYRLWLITKLWSSGDNQKYLWAYNLGSYFLAGVIGGGLAIVGLKLYFHSKDKKYRRIDRDLSNGPDV